MDASDVPAAGGLTESTDLGGEGSNGSSGAAILSVAAAGDDGRSVAGVDSGSPRTTRDQGDERLRLFPPNRVEWASEADEESAAAAMRAATGGTTAEDSPRRLGFAIHATRAGPPQDRIPGKVAAADGMPSQDSSLNQ